MTQWDPKNHSNLPDRMKQNIEQSKIRQEEWEERHRREMEELEQRLKRREREQRREEIREDSIGFFLQAETGFTYDLSSGISSQELYEIDCTWCAKEQVVPEGLRALSWRLKHDPGYPVRETILTRHGCRCRGFRGIRAVTDDTDKRNAL